MKKPFFWGVILCGVCLAGLLSGCGESGPPKATVHGKVTFDGAPVEKGSIAFIPKEGPDAGAEIENGTYRTRDGNGPTLGPHRVEITAYREGKVVQTPGAGGLTDGPSGPSSGATMEMYIPEKYNKKSELTLDVKVGDNEKDFALTK